MRVIGKPTVAVIGAGAFGGWTALHLQRGGSKVTLVDAWGPGNSLASSAGESRVIRATYGEERVYVEMATRALKLWRKYEVLWKRRFYHHTGVLWLSGSDDTYEKASLRVLREAGVPVEVLQVEDAGKLYPQINFEGVSWILHEPDAGYLAARCACQAVVDAFIAEGGEYCQLSAARPHIDAKRLKSISLSDGSTLGADLFVFACGPWMGKLFPEAIGDLVRPTRQEEYFFGTPLGDTRFFEHALPICIDPPSEGRYGSLPENGRRGFKVLSDLRGPSFDPSFGERLPTAEGIAAARRYLGFRFPALKTAPLVETRVCQYENTPDSNFIIDRHPQTENVWLLGGGSGHGFKHGPVIGEQMAEHVLVDSPLDPKFCLSRFN